MHSEQVPTVANHVSYILIDGEAILLNRKTGKYLGLNAVATHIVEMFNGASNIQQITSALAADYNISIELARKDINNFVQEAKAFDVVVLYDTPQHESKTSTATRANGQAPIRHNSFPQARFKAGPFLIIRAYLCLLMIDLRFQITEFDRVVKWVATDSGSKGTATPDPEIAAKSISQVCHAVQTAARFYYRKRRDCLPNAMLAYYLLRRQGVPVNFCIGVTKFPFKGHAWVEYEGRVVFTTPASLWKYRAVMTI